MIQERLAIENHKKFQQKYLFLKLKYRC